MRPDPGASLDAHLRYSAGYQEFASAREANERATRDRWTAASSAAGGAGAGAELPDETFFYIALVCEALALAYGMAYLFWGYVLDTSIMSGFGTIFGVFGDVIDALFRVLDGGPGKVVDAFRLIHVEHSDMLIVWKLLRAIGWALLILPAYLRVNHTRQVLSWSLWPRILIWSGPAAWMGVWLEHFMAGFLNDTFGLHLHAAWQILGAALAILTLGTGIHLGQSEAAEKREAEFQAKLKANEKSASPIARPATTAL